ncbi:flippase [Candidatus Woesearchaeota archaeon]|jgi:O-antigen/teichoic acid export membrane protein|nr:flippase [Candidatus Woesearchaeota archaeon]MBT5397238.1 flippase [Candidatus Woesearchaeota archaeon]MBT5924303.1 flippase [Candidatus Woesearchaeota archaeon]MBT6367216.1 flippase [Candidatus Woesearchaeota archaeon]MBT7762638.1 flippase [Candidatus Woesearchaeota archaeon]
MKLPHTNYTRKAVKGVGIVAILMAITSLLAYILRVVLARKLSPTDFGLFYAVLAFMMFLLLFRDFGLRSGLVKFIAHYAVEKNYSKIKTLIVASFVFQLISSTILIVFFILSSSYLADNYFKDPRAATLLILFAIYVFVSLLCNVAYSILQGFQKVKWYGSEELIRLGMTIVSFFILYSLGYGILSAAIAFVIGSTTAFLVLMIKVVQFTDIWKAKITDLKIAIKELFTFSAPVIFTGVGNKVIAWLDVLILTYFVSLEKVGVYNVVLPTALLFLFFAKANSKILLPMVSELWARKDHKRLFAGVQLLYKYTFMITLPLIISIFVFAPLFIETLFGPEYLSGILAFRIILVGVLGYVIAANNHAIITAIGKPAIVMKIVLFAAAINIILNILLIPALGIVGAALSTAISYGCMLILSTNYVTKFIAMPSPWKIWMKIVGAGFVFTAILLILSSTILIGWLGALVSICISSILYLIILSIIKAFNIQEINNLIKLVKK